MLVFVVYDISENKSRTALIKRLHHFGLHRIQKSVFTGFMEFDARLSFFDDIETYISSENDSIIMIPICDKCADSIDICSDSDISLPRKIEFKLL
ncbi:CRISPR-associated endonuclease Cas2 [Methanobrevibacter filiformis]|uniref:CRISPR-associated endoribonuclease Cas2 n=1 Tax=Methanobrevibacter filiformis TaxID=55758 RepID=A0A165Z6W3_9EURY|nr:CRISPR-associated endonuclease Cas2 [Methanobrevibacter filiformis]KZX10322.1 CRISPR-associated endoribonuclease Cas2 [Methanobrevibacter filiformis]